MDKIVCEDCVHLGGYRFERNYHPKQFLEGKRSSEIWIVGLNPAQEIGFQHSKTREQLEKYYDSGETFDPYIRKFKNVSKILYEGLGKEGGTATTDLVKCASKAFPGGAKGAELVANCSEYLKTQILEYKPRLILCNGRPVSDYVKKQFPKNKELDNTDTSYWTTVDDVVVCVVLSGFIGRIDNYARKRLGYEIEMRLDESRIHRV